jgi:hypothetical protein
LPLPRLALPAAPQRAGGAKDDVSRSARRPDLSSLGLMVLDLSSLCLT